MIKKIMVFLVITMLAAILPAQTKIIPMPDLQKPETLSVDQTQMYVTEGVFIYIYSLKDFKLIKKIGQKGEGPQEFMLNPAFGPLVINVQTEDIFADSLGKVSWFAKDGTYKKEQKLPSPLILFIQPLGKNFVGMGFEQEGQKLMKKLNLYDDKFSKLKEIKKVEHDFQQGKGLTLLKTFPLSVTYDNKLFVAWEADIIIDVLDPDINKLYTIKHDIDRRPVTEEVKKAVIEFLKTNPATKDAFEFLKPFNFPSHFPAMQNIFVTGDKIYLVTFKEEGKQNEVLILDLKGKLLKRALITLKMNTPIIPFPYAIHEGFFYQMAEAPDEEGWNLYVMEIK
ncbi:MAG: hypothetical protein NT166_01000 [Candidatus Aminicenantes bacterium]|nr:hypothetical protein [Candidatus Aminicenantes bacterium]